MFFLLQIFYTDIINAAVLFWQVLMKSSNESLGANSGRWLER